MTIHDETPHTHDIATPDYWRCPSCHHITDPFEWHRNILESVFAEQSYRIRQARDAQQREEQYREQLRRIQDAYRRDTSDTGSIILGYIVFGAVIILVGILVYLWMS